MKKESPSTLLDPLYPLLLFLLAFNVRVVYNPSSTIALFTFYHFLPKSNVNVINIF